MMKVLRKIRHKYFYRQFIRPVYQKLFGYKYLKNRNQVFHEYGLELLQRLNQAMNEINCPYWLEFGTLLGAVREKGFIQHDFDIDIGIFRKDFNVCVQDALIKYGLKPYRKIYSPKYDATEITFIYKGVTVDFFLFDLASSDNLMFCYGFEVQYSKSLIDDFRHLDDYVIEKCFFPEINLRSYTFMGIETFIPENWDAHLKMQYGENYMIPNANWDTTSSPGIELLYDSSINVELFLE